MKMWKNKAGFTLPEVLLSIALFSAIVGLSIPIYQGFEFRNEVASSANVIVGAARTAQTKAKANENDSQWGIYVSPGLVTIFSGSTYASRNTTLDIEQNLPGAPEISGQDEFIFNQLTGEVPIPGSMTLTLRNITRTIEINEKGTILY